MSASDIFEAVPGGEPCGLSEELQLQLRLAVEGWRRAQALMLALTGALLEYTPLQLLDNSITDAPDGTTSPMSERLRAEARDKHDEALRFVCGLMGSM